VLRLTLDCLLDQYTTFPKIQFPHPTQFAMSGLIKHWVAEV